MSACVTGLQKIKITSGEYKPTADANVLKYFNVPSGVIIEGGYIGITDEIPTKTNVNSLTTILSGDVTPDSDLTNNSEHILVFDGTSSNTEIRYCKIQKGSGKVISEFETFKIIDFRNAGNGTINTSEISLNNSPLSENIINVEVGSTFTLKNSKYKFNQGSILNYGTLIAFDNYFENCIGLGVIDNQNSMFLGSSVFKNNSFQYSPLVKNAGTACSIYGCIFLGDQNIYDQNIIYSSKNINVTNTVFRISPASQAGIANSAINETLNSVNYINCFFKHSGFPASSLSIKNTATGLGQMNVKVKNCIFSYGNGISNGAGVTADVTYNSFEYNNNTVPVGVGNNNWTEIVNNDIDWEGPDGVFFTEDDKYNTGCASQYINSGNADPSTTSLDITGKKRIMGSAIDRGPFERFNVGGNRIYVNQNAPVNSTQDGLSWANAINEFYFVIENKGCLSNNEVWLAAGTYVPNNGVDLDLNKSFDIPSGLKVYGSFQGNETSLSQRLQSNFANFQSTLTGLMSSQPSVYHVVTLNNAGSATILDGFKIEGGYAVGDNNDGIGGGLLIISDLGFPCKPEINNCTFTDNLGSYGGAVANIVSTFAYSEASPIFTNCIFKNNAALYGGAIHNQTDIGVCNPVFINSGFISNIAYFGGSQYSYVSLSFGTSTPYFYNCTIRKNPVEPPTTVSFFSSKANTTAVGGFTPRFYNTVLLETGANQNPFFNNLPVFNVTRFDSYLESFLPNPTSKLNGTKTLAASYFNGFNLLAGNPLINEGKNVHIPVGVNKDLNGGPRLRCSVDIGCTEFQADVNTSPLNFPIGADISSGYGTWQLYNFITAQNKINSPADAGVYAAKSVILNPGFEAKPGSVFRAEIKACN
jgi:hypothetical protein